MYHDTINIRFIYNNQNDINFDYNFFISKNNQNNHNSFSSILYKDLLDKFKDIGFDLKYLKFNDIDKNNIIYCSYNFQSNFEIFFKVYNKLIKSKKFNISIEYGNIINGKFIPNNMNYFAGISFNHHTIEQNGIKEEVIKGKFHKKTMEYYQIIEKDGNIIANELTTYKKDFKQHFFEQYEVKVALRKYKLGRLKGLFK